MEIYGDAVYNDDSVIARYTPPEGKEAGSLSYAAGPQDGYTIIAIDSARYSADNTESGLDEHETSGAVSADLEKWVVEQITAAKERGRYGNRPPAPRHGAPLHHGARPAAHCTWSTTMSA